MHVSLACQDINCGRPVDALRRQKWGPWARCKPGRCGAKSAEERAERRHGDVNSLRFQVRIRKRWEPMPEIDPAGGRCWGAYGSFGVTRVEGPLGVCTYFLSISADVCGVQVLFSHVQSLLRGPSPHLARLSCCPMSFTLVQRTSICDTRSTSEPIDIPPICKRVLSGRIPCGWLLLCPFPPPSLPKLFFSLATL
ncbi:hypothetical protein CALVIDRAFT_120351 [Calocera viscosa TUFC12733]|uniref:Uncharacterized protein n=1 Tax=Calocera viscosa (strain TUFC12733) TaxID=1330018 RepID=A0A167MA73_CALVF|nr:hypothetical protein CALVIDRAFT_120351 [Calocera viscosa TUFC12733]